MNKLCPKCYFLGIGKVTIFINPYVGFGIILTALSIYFSGLDEQNKIIETIRIIIASLIAYAGVRVLIKFYRGPSTCPICDHKPMLNLDELEAIEIIRDKSKEIHTGSKEKI